MWKKIINILLISIVMTGCSANYNLKIDDSKIKEELLLDGADITELKDNNIPINYENDDIDVYKTKIKGVKYYNVEYKNDKANINYTFDYDNFKNSTVLNKCYDEIDAYVEKNVFILSTTGDFKCFKGYEELDEVNINIYSQYKLINSNADNKKGFNYQWNIKNNNISDGIYLELDLSKRYDTLQEKIINSRFFSTIIFIGLVVIASIIFIIFKKISEAKDKI